MIALKKLYGDELLRLALILSLLKADPNEYLAQETQALIAGLSRANGTDWSIQPETRILTRHIQIHPKSLDHTLVQYERQLFEELNSLGRYNSENTNRILSQPYLHTYLVNNVATETATPTLQNDPVSQADSNDIDGVSADDNVAHEVKIDDNSQENTTNDAVEVTEAVVTLSADFLNNRTGSDIFADIVSRTYDVNDFLIPSNNMFVKEETEDASTSDLDVVVKKEPDTDLYSDDNAIDYGPYFEKRSKFEIEDPEDVFNQNIADLQDYGDFDTNKDLRALDLIDVKQDPENLEKYLLENTPLESEEMQLASIFDEGMILEMKRERASTSFTSASSSSGVSEMDGYDSKVDVKTEDEGHHTGDELTQEDMDLIEVLWKQDVDMGFCLNAPDVHEAVASQTASPGVEKHKKPTDDEIRAEDVEKVKASLLDTAKEDDPWAGISYTIDTETGEYVVQGELPGSLVEEGTRFDLLEEALQLVELSDDVKDEQPLEGATGGAEAGTMLHPAMARHALPHHMAHYHNQSLMRSMSVEQRWQDLASLLTVPPPPEQYHYQHHVHNMSAHGAAGYAPSYAPVAPHMPEKHHEHYGAPAPLDGAYKVESAHHPQQHDAIYYQNPPAEMGPTNQDGFLQSILNDEDLQLMDMAMNEGMYTMRILDGGGSAGAPIPATAAAGHNHTHLMMAERDSGSDSAVSSMGSERVPSLSDGEWDSHNEYHSSKFRPYDASYGRERVNPNAVASQPQAQKKHHMFGKRCFQEQSTPQLEPLSAHPALPPRELSVIKYECSEPTPAACQHEHMQLHNLELTSRPTPLPPHMGVLHPPLDLNGSHHTLLQGGMSSPVSNPGRFAFGASSRIRHNHTYCAPEHGPPSRDKRVRRLTDGSMSDGGSTASGHLTRDEKRAKALGIPIEVQDIINLPMDEFNERLSKHDLSEAQLSLIRDIRRRGKNKVAAQNCRKRKLDQITSLADEVRLVRDRKIRTQRDHASLTADRQRVKERFAALYRHVFQNLRDPEGRPLSSSQYSLQQAADGNVVLVPRMHHPNDQSMNRTSDDEIDRKTKSYDQ